MTATQDGDVLMRRLIVHTVIWLVILGAILFLSAGTLDWPEAWVLLIGSGALGLVSALIIARHDPRSCANACAGRSKASRSRGTRLCSSSFSCCASPCSSSPGSTPCATAPRICRSGSRCTGAAGIALGIYIFHVVMRTNSYATAVVRIQNERGHQVISTGPYAFVRHPMYSGAILYFLGIALLLGSWYAVGIAVALIALFGLRAVWEEQTLIDELPGYAAYAERVRYRLIPGIW